MAVLNPPCGTKPYRNLVFPVHAGLRGRYRYEVLDELGRPEVIRLPSGMAANYDGKRWLPNLITDAGLERVAECNDVVGSGGSFVTTLRNLLAVGTGSAAPAFTDEALTAEVARSGASTPGGQNGKTVVWDGGDEVVRSVGYRDITILMAENRNLTEYGFSHHASAAQGPLNIRALFTDELGNPIALSLLAGKSIRVVHEMTLEIGPIPAAGHAAVIQIEEYDATNTLIATHPISVVYGWSGSTMGITNCWHPEGSNFAQAYSAGGSAYNRLTAPISGNPALNNAGADTRTIDPYVGGSRERIKRRLVPPTGEVGDWGAFSFGMGFGGGLAVHLVSPVSFTKLDTHTMSYAMKSTWGRL